MKVPSHRTALVCCLVLAALLSLPGLWMGLFMDDYFHVAILEKLVPFGSIWGLFDFSPARLGAHQEWRSMLEGVLPWYTLPEFKASFFRPLTCILAASDHWLFGRNYVAWHLHSMLWHLLLIAVYALVARRALPGPAGLLTLLIFTLAPSHWFPVVWVANRNALVAVVPALFGLYMHIRWREDGYKPGLPLSLLGYMIGFTGGETAMGVLAYVAAYELFAQKGGISRRAVALAPAAVLAAAYLVLYKFFGYGSYGSGSYVNPLEEPLRYALHAPPRMLMLIAAQLAGFSADLLVFAERLRPVNVCAGIATLLVFLAAIRRAWPEFDPGQRRALKWMAAGSLLSMLPFAATFPTNRLLLVPSIGAAAVLALVLADWRRRWRQRRAEGWLTALAIILITVHFVAAPGIWAGQSLAFTWFGKRVQDTCMAAEVPAQTTPGARLVLLPGCDPVTTLYTPIVRAVLQSRPLSRQDFWLVTSQAPYDHRLTVTAPDTFQIDVLEGSMLGSEFERLFRGPEYAFAVGQQVGLDYVTATVLKLGATGPSKVEFKFDRPLNDPSLVFLQWREGHLRKASLPDIGQSTLFPWTRGLLHY